MGRRFLALLYEAVQKDHVFLMGTESHSAPHPSPAKSVPVSAAIVHARVDPAGNAQGIYLSGKAVSHGIHRVSLVGWTLNLSFMSRPPYSACALLLVCKQELSPPVYSTCNPMLIKTVTYLFALKIILHADIFILPFI